MLFFDRYLVEIMSDPPDQIFTSCPCFSKSTHWFNGILIAPYKNYFNQNIL